MPLILRTGMHLCVAAERRSGDGGVMTVVIRPAIVADLEPVLALVTEVIGEFGLAFGEGSPTDDHLRGLPGSYRDHGGEFWVATDRDGLVGTCGMYPVSPAVFELRKMYLLERARGQHLGRRLLDMSIEWARARGATSIVLDTIEEMQRAIAFYEANGFTRNDCEIRGARCTRGYALALHRLEQD